MADSVPSDQREKRRQLAEEMAADAQRLFEEDEKLEEEGVEVARTPTDGVIAMLWEEMLDLRLRVEELETRADARPT